jgi:hypothetical protein
VNFIFVAVLAGKHIVHDGGALGTKSALAVFAKSNGGLVRVGVAVHKLLK